MANMTMICGEPLTYEELSMECKLALLYNYQFLTQAEMEEVVKGRVFCFELITMEESKRRCMAESDDLREDHKTFDAYHSWYWGDGHDMPDHGLSRWPCITPGIGEWLLDGWHRFHSYVEAGDTVVPLLTFL